MSAVVVAVVFAALAWRQHRLVDQYAVDVLYMDQWDLFNPLFAGAGWWDTFAYQHGPHRQGVGGLLARVLAEKSGWNTRWEAFAASYLMIAAAGAAMLIARRAGVRAGLGLTAIPLLFFNLRQYELFVGATNVAHAALPLLMIMGIVLAWFSARRSVRLTALSVLSVGLIFTGFGLFAALVTPAVLVLEALQAARARDSRHAGTVLAAVAVIVAGWLVFARGYVVSPAVADFEFPHDPVVDYVYFMAYMLANFLGVIPTSPAILAIGLVAVAVLVGLCGWHGFRLLRDGVEDSPQSVVIATLAGFALLYCAFTAVGRVVLGWEDGSLVSRYVTLMVPAGLAVFLHVATVPSARVAGGLGLIFALLLVPGTARLRGDDWAGIRWYAEGKSTWRTTYLATHDEIQAAEQANFDIYPASVADKLRILEERQLNLFRPPPASQESVR